MRTFIQLSKLSLFYYALSVCPFVSLSSLSSSVISLFPQSLFKPSLSFLELIRFKHYNLGTLKAPSNAILFNLLTFFLFLGHKTETNSLALCNFTIFIFSSPKMEKNKNSLTICRLQKLERFLRDSEGGFWLEAKCN